MTAPSIDLSENRDVTAALLLEPLAWRVRAVEHLEVDSDSTCIRRRSLQCGPLRSVLSEHVELGEAQSAFLVLNVATLPRALLFDFDVQGPGGTSAFLLSRTEIAAREVHFLCQMAARAGLSVPSQLLPFLEAMVGMTDAPWGKEGPPSNLTGIAEFIRSGIGDPGESLLSNWMALSDEVHELLSSRTEGPGPYTPVEQPVLAIPDLFNIVEIRALDEVTAVLEGYRNLVRAAQAGSNMDRPTDADDFLNSLADYGRHYEMLVDVDVPLDRPFVIEYSERRPMKLSWRNRGYQDLVIADAQSNHVSLRVTDPNVRIRDLTIRTPDRKDVAYGIFRILETNQAQTFYAYDRDRDYRVAVRFHVAPLWRLSFVPYTVLLVIVALTVALVHEGLHTLKDLALIVGPSAIAASVLAAREPTTLGSRLRRMSTLALAVALAVMLAVAAGEYVHGNLSASVARVVDLGGRAARLV